MHEGLQHGHDAVFVHAQHPHHILAGRSAQGKTPLQGLLLTIVLQSGLHKLWKDLMVDDLGYCVRAQKHTDWERW